MSNAGVLEWGAVVGVRQCEVSAAMGPGAIPRGNPATPAPRHVSMRSVGTWADWSGEGHRGGARGRASGTGTARQGAAARGPGPGRGFWSGSMGRR